VAGLEVFWVGFGRAKLTIGKELMQLILDYLHLELVLISILCQTTQMKLWAFSVEPKA
jgi:hypothetical protein